MFVCEPLMTKTWQFTLPVPLAFRSSSSLTPSFVFTRRVPLRVQLLICYKAQIVQKPVLVFGVERRQIHVLRFTFCLSKEAADLLPNVLAFYAIVVQHVGRAVHLDADFRQVRVELLY